MSDDVELCLVTMRFAASAPEQILGILSKYIVLTRQADGCRNVDLIGSAMTLHDFLVIEKWDSPISQRAHFESVEMVEMAHACEGLLSAPPVIELWDAISAHDLR